jgi:hypothetical protein
MDLRSACLATAALHRLHAKLDAKRRAFHLDQAEKLEARAKIELRLTMSFNRRYGRLQRHKSTLLTQPVVPLEVAPGLPAGELRPLLIARLRALPTVDVPIYEDEG